MLNIRHGDIFSDKEADTFVNPVNCVGVMGAGLAKVFKNRYPDNYQAYRSYCRKGSLRPGGLFLTVNPIVIINLATKHHWKDPSRLDWIETGLDNLDRLCQDNHKVVALPMLGAGYGGLDKHHVMALTKDKLTGSKVLYNLWIYEPERRWQ